MMKLTGLFLGAGASYEVGMPLVWELTEELKDWLTPGNVRDLNDEWRKQGGGHRDATLEHFMQLLGRKDLHYEAVLGALETEFRRSRPQSQEFHWLYSWFVQMVYVSLLYRHAKNVPFIEGHLRHLAGIARLAELNSPLWIFSLNHDLIIECLAAQHGIPINSGFSSEIVTLPRRDGRGNKIGELRAETLTSEHLEKTGMPFLRRGEHGINLLKIHGALDIFAFRNGKDLLKLLPTKPGVDGVIGALEAANEELLYYEPRAPRKRVTTTNEITYADDDGEMQFLRRTLLAGAYKFDNRASQVIPQKLLDHFRSHLNHVSTLICIGYGFGDLHINSIIRSWLEFAADRRLVIVSPGARDVPSSLLHLASQVTVEAATASDFLDRTTGIVRSRRETIEKRFTSWARRKFTLKEQRKFLQVAKRALVYAEAMKRRADERVARIAARDKG